MFPIQSSCKTHGVQEPIPMYGQLFLYQVSGIMNVRCISYYSMFFYSHIKFYEIDENKIK